MTEGKEGQAALEESFIRAQILPIYGYGIEFHLLASSWIAFINVLQFSGYRTFSSLFRLILAIFCSYCKLDCFLDFIFRIFFVCL
jgi:hypothetical protein